VTPAEAAVLALVAASVFFSFVAAVGFLRLPDVFARAHAASKSETLGALFGLAAAAVAFGPGAETVKLGQLAVFVLVTSPTAVHAIARAATLAGATPRTRTDDGTKPEEGR
jgi:multicomponent Na+:H+ antiporter subunit G